MKSDPFPRLYAYSLPGNSRWGSWGDTALSHGFVDLGRVGVPQEQERCGQRGNTDGQQSGGAALTNPVAACA